MIRDREARKIYLAYDSYIEKIANRFRLNNEAYPSVTPLSIKKLHRHEETATKQKIKAYQKRVRSILYTAIIVRPDIAYAALTLSKFLTNPSPTHFREANRVISYLYATRYLGIVYGGNRKKA